MLSQREIGDLLAMAAESKTFISAAKKGLKAAENGEDDQARKRFKRGLDDSWNRIVRCETALKRELETANNLVAIKESRRVNSGRSEWRDSGRSTQSTNPRKLERREADRAKDVARNEII